MSAAPKLTPELIGQVARLPGGIDELKKARQALREERNKQEQTLREILDQADSLIHAMDLAIDGLGA